MLAQGSGPGNRSRRRDRPSAVDQGISRSGLDDAAMAMMTSLDLAEVAQLRNDH